MFIFHELEKYREIKSKEKAYREKSIDIFKTIKLRKCIRLTSLIRLTCLIRFTRLVRLTRLIRLTRFEYSLLAIVTDIANIVNKIQLVKDCA